MKSMYDNNREQELIDSLKSLEVKPPSGLWDDIDATLKAKRRKRFIIISSWASAATIAILFTIGGTYSIQNRVETISTINPIDNSTNIDKKEAALSPLNFIRKEQSRSSQNIESEDEQIAFASPSIAPTELDSLKKDEEIIIPNKLYAIQPKITSRVNVPNQIIASNYSQTLAIVDPVKVKGDWYFSASGFPVYSFHSAGAMNKAGTQQQTGIVSWGGSVSARFAFANRISIETGITYSIMGQQQKNLYLAYSSSRNLEVYNNDGFTNNYGTLNVSNPDYRLMDMGIVNKLTNEAFNESNFKAVDASQKFRYLEVPILISKGFYYKGFNLYIKGGLSAGILVQNQLDLRGSNIHLQGKTTGVDPFTASALTSIGISIPIINKTNLLIEPSFKLGLKSLSNMNGKSYPFSSFIKFGVEIPI